MKPPSPHSPRILLIDDNPAIHQDYRKVLAPHTQDHSTFNDLESIVLGETTATASLQNVSFEIDSAMQGQQGLVCVQKALEANRPYSVAFVDMRMDPGWNGLETIKHLWKAQPSLQIVLCSAYSDFSWKEIVTELGTSDSLVILRKPFDNVEVLQLALALSRKWQIMQELRSHVRNLDTQLHLNNSELARVNEDLRRQIAERASAEERFRSAFESSPLAKCIVNVQTLRWMDANAAFAALSGWSCAELARQAINVGSFWSGQPDDLTSLLGANTDINGTECGFLNRKGEERRILFSRKFMQLKGEAHILLTLDDVTERRAAEEQTRQGLKLEAIGRLAAGVAHDFNNILTVIKSHASLLLGDEKVPAHAQHAIEQMADAARRATGLVRQLLAFGRQQIIAPRALDVAEHIELQSSMLTRLIGERITLRWEHQKAMPAAMVDPGSLDQVLLNLVVNARDAMPQGGTVTITSCTAIIDEHHCATHRDARPGDYILIRVADTGSGIPIEIQSRIFEPFFSTKTTRGGTGLGLATVHGLVKQQGGWLELESAPGDGTTFFIYLPQATAAAERARPATEPMRANDWRIGGGRVAMIVEDDETIRSVLRQLLTRFGFDTIDAANASQALEIWHQRMSEIQLVITDVVMPGTISGLDLGERLIADKPRLKIVYCTGYSAEMLSSKRAMVEGENFLPKPYDAHNLLTVLNKLFPKASGKPPTGRLKPPSPKRITGSLLQTTEVLQKV